MQCSPTVGSQRVYILFWQWPQAPTAEMIHKILCLPASPAGYPEQVNGPWWCWADLSVRPTTQSWDLLGLTYVYSPRCGAAKVSNPLGHQISQAYWEPSVTLIWIEKCPSTHAGVPFLCWNNSKSPKTAEHANRRWLMLTLKLQRYPQRYSASQLAKPKLGR